MGSRRVGHDWTTSLWLFTFKHWRRKWQPTPGFLPGKSHGQRSPLGHSMGSQRVWHDWAHAHHIKGWIHLNCRRQDWWIRKGIYRSSILRAAANPANHTVSSISWVALFLLLMVSESMPWFLLNSWHYQDCYGKNVPQRISSILPHCPRCHSSL